MRNRLYLLGLFSTISPHSLYQTFKTIQDALVPKNSNLHTSDSIKDSHRMLLVPKKKWQKLQKKQNHKKEKKSRLFTFVTTCFDHLDKRLLYTNIY